MEWLRSPKHKALAALVALLLLIGVGLAPALTPASAARALLGAAAIAGLALWLHRALRAPRLAASAPRLHVVSRAALSARCGLALVEVEGRAVLVAFGDGFAHVVAPEGASR